MTVNGGAEIEKIPVDIHRRHHQDLDQDLKTDPVVLEEHETHQREPGVGPTCVGENRPTCTLEQVADLHCHLHHPAGRSDLGSANGTETES